MNKKRSYSDFRVGCNEHYQTDGEARKDSKAFKLNDGEMHRELSKCAGRNSRKTANYKDLNDGKVTGYLTNYEKEEEVKKSRKSNRSHIGGKITARKTSKDLLHSG